MKKLISLAMVTIMSFGFIGCGSKTETATPDTSVESEAPSEEAPADEVEGEAAPEGELLKVGMATDSGTIDDKSFNQGTWEGIVAYEEDNGTIETRYIQPVGETEQDYLNAFADLIDAGYQVIFAPGYKFESAIGKAQEMYPDVKFIILDGTARDADGNEVLAPNSRGIYFDEHEAGFYAGIVSAVESKTGKLGYIGGMEIPAVQKFGWGYAAGVAYANENYGTEAVVSQYIYQGTFTDVAAGKTLAGSFFDSGCDIVFSAAGGVGVGVIAEAKTRRQAGEDVYVVGVDVDQYDDGLLDDGTSAVLTSATKDLNEAAYLTIDEIVNGAFKGNKNVTFNSAINGVGLPPENPNLTEESLDIYNQVYELVAAGDVVVPSSVEELTTFLDEHGYTTPEGIVY
ncbi:MAG: BMP family ABC transporter substrate-binding protein [Lachnospirales bacterium]